MNYQRVHDRLIARAKRRQAVGYNEVHHIVPRCLGGSESPDNLVPLMFREHFLLHWLLTKLCVGEERRRLLHAMGAMARPLPGRPKLTLLQRRAVDRALKTAKLYQLVIALVGPDDYYVNRKGFPWEDRGEFMRTVKHRLVQRWTVLPLSERKAKEKLLASVLLALDSVARRRVVQPVEAPSSPFTPAHTLSFPPWVRCRVMFYHEGRRFGFIRPVDGSESVFLSNSRLPKNYGKLHPGQPCACIPVPRRGGFFAKQFVLLHV